MNLIKLIILLNMQNKNTTFMKNLIKLRKSKGLSQLELSQKTGLSIRMISYYENKAISPPLDKIKIIADALNVTVADLLNETKSENNSNIDTLDPRIIKKIINIKKLPVRSQNAIWKYIDYISEQTKQKKQQKVLK